MQGHDRSIADNFMGMIKSLSPETRLELISRISDSLREQSTGTDLDNTLNSLFGAFKSKQSAEEIIEELRGNHPMGSFSAD